MMAESICIFEDEGWSLLEPLVSTRPIYALRLGMTTLREKTEGVLAPENLALHCRAELAASVSEDNPGIPVNDIPFDRCLFVNGRAVGDESLVSSLRGDDDRVYRSGEDVVAARVSGDRLQKLSGMLGDCLGNAAWEGLPAEKIDAELVRYPWDLIKANPGETARDFQRAHRGPSELSSIPPGVHLINRDAIHLGEGCLLSPGVVVDATEGPVVIESDVEVRANSVILGPSVVGRGTILQPLTVLDASTVGPVCKLGGEIRECIIQGYSNKQHSGFLGHAYLGAWVNLGAETTNSDLKNNYSKVRVQIGDRQMDSGELFVGSFIGDHTKSAIGSRFNTGSVFGVCCLLYAAGFVPKYVPSFTWLGNEGPVKYSFQNAIDTAKTVMARRGLSLTRAKENVLRGVYERGQNIKRKT
jgi:UDP-N-acetylglucosamine diphosphorylase/glucosamine-1-phosphate N-acetyltransferase